MRASVFGPLACIAACDRREWRRRSMSVPSDVLEVVQWPCRCACDRRDVCGRPDACRESIFMASDVLELMNELTGAAQPMRQPTRLWTAWTRHGNRRDGSWAYQRQGLGISRLRFISGYPEIFHNIHYANRVRGDAAALVRNRNRILGRIRSYFERLEVPHILCDDGKVERLCGASYKSVCHPGTMSGYDCLGFQLS